MPQATFHFPKGFLWGTATASHQVEGNNTNNNWYAWENEPGRIIQGHHSGLACDWWGGRWKEDFNRAAETGQNAHRMSVEWSRIQPTPDRWDESALDHYRQMVRGLVERNLTPMITFHHFTDPLWLSEKGGWENDETPILFGKFVRKVVEALKEYVTLWVPVNEPNVYTSEGYASGNFPPGRNNLGQAFKVMRNLVKGHAAAYHVTHEIQPEARLGICMHYRGFQPARAWNPLDGIISNLLSNSFNDAFPRAIATGTLSFGASRASIPEARGTMDFFGLNYYSCDLVKFVLSPANVFSKRYYPTDAELSTTGYLANLPLGMRKALKWAAAYNQPIIITENGVEDKDDILRPRYTVEHLHQVWKVASLSVPIKGYFHWSLVDNFEWERGWTQRFGLWELNTETQARTRRPSVDLYASICKNNAISYEAVEKYAPGSLKKLFPE